MTAVDPHLRATKTTCAYCGVGCGVLATPDGRGGAAILGDPEHPANFGRLCSKGSALGETLGLENRLLHPMIRCDKGTMERVAWSDALRPCRAPFSASSRVTVPAPSRSISPGSY
jgi:assimilatory nitrate reductase catalytic subunit